MLKFQSFVQSLLEKKFGVLKTPDTKFGDFPKEKSLKGVVSNSCSKCGKLLNVCQCYVDDYYDAELTQQTPTPKHSKDKEE